ncbi:hypothetical protein AGOR_G00246260 [Albula goreensis]|uniref:Fibronectin type-III domain-containing protein n=1 Tax=Albula goreensis TaxID=1534307 RepID=A0A8T3CAM4_9TELE|nr:hypothetical protein AGOR_G00246260 [Albula goreensis]
MNVTQISKRTYAFTVHTQNPSLSAGSEVECGVNGTTIWAGHSPDDHDLKCETDLKSAECSWNRGRRTHLVGKSRMTVYSMNGRNCTKANEVSQSREVTQYTCNPELSMGEKNWTLTARNPLGSVVLTYTADLSHRIRIQPPEKVTSEVHARNATIHWSLKLQKYSNLSLLCQVELTHADHKQQVNGSGMGLSSLVLEDLQPHRYYSVAVRCATAKHFWKWSDWSSIHKFQTKEDCPKALDMWFQRKSKDNAVILWKALSDVDSNGRIKGYKVTWGGTEHNCELSQRSYVLPLGDGNADHTATVIAFNSACSSPPSKITIPRWTGDANVSASEILGNDDGFHLSWSANVGASCGYIVDWCPTYSGQDCVAEWVKVPAGTTEVRSQSVFIPGSFKPGERYSLSIYACSQGPPKLLHKMEGYVKEMAPADPVQNLKVTEEGSTVVLLWEAVPPWSQRGFIRGYNIYLNNNSHPSVNIANPDARKHIFDNMPNSSYSFTVKAYTSAGEDNGVEMSIKLNHQADQPILAILLSLGSMTLLLFLIPVMYYHRRWMKEKFYPDIPKPKLPDDWSASTMLDGRTVDVTQCPCDTLHIVTNLKEESGEGLKEHSNSTMERRYFSQLNERPLQRPLNLALPVGPAHVSSISLGSCQTYITYTELQTPTVRSGLPSTDDAQSSEDYKPQNSAASPTEPQGIPPHPILMGDYQPQFSPHLLPATELNVCLDTPTSVSSFTPLLSNDVMENSQDQSAFPSSSWYHRCLPDTNYSNPTYCLTNLSAPPL